MRSILPAMILLAFWPGPLGAVEPRIFCGKTVEGWSAVLRNSASTAVERQQAIQALAAFGAEARAAVPLLIGALKQETTKEAALIALSWIGGAPEQTVPLLIDQFIRQGCLHLTGAGAIGYSNSVRDALVRIGEPAVPALIGVLTGTNREMRVCAADALAQFGPAARAAIPALVHAIEHPEPSHVAEILVRHSARALGRIGPEAKAAAPALTRLLDDGGIDESEIIRALDRIGAPPTRKLLDTLLNTGESYAATELATLGPTAREAIPGLRKALADRRPQVRFSAAAALASIEPAAAEAIPVLIESLNHLDDQQLDLPNVPAVLGRLGPKADAAIPKLAELLRNGSSDPEVFYALAQIDLEGKQSVPAFISALSSRKIDVVDTAANSLGLLGRRAKAAVPALARVLTRDYERDEGITDYNHRVSAAKALRRIGPQARAAVPFLAGALKFRRQFREFGFGEGDLRTDFSTATAAAETLGSFREAASAAVPALIEAVQSREEDDIYWTVREAAILALGQIGTAANAAVPVLRKLLKDNDKSDHLTPAILVALHQLDPNGKALAAKWLEQHSGPDRFGGQMYLNRHGRALLLGALGRTSTETDWLAQRYMDRLDAQFANAEPPDDDVPMFMDDWFESLGRCGASARVALPRLNKYLNHPSPFVRLWAAEAIAKIRSPAREPGNAQPGH